MKITVFTPTYNRRQTLDRCYQSLLDQNVDFEWLIVDDGSTDDTSALIEQFQSENKIKIRYLYQENLGKQAAWNLAVKEAHGDYFIGLDSDDAMQTSVLKKLINYVGQLEADPSLIGLRCQAVRSTTGNTDGGDLCSKPTKINWLDEFFSEKNGERIDLFKRKVLSDYLYPVSLSVKFVPENWLYASISKKYSFLYLPTPVIVFFDDHDSNRLSRSSLKKHAEGHYIARRKILNSIPSSYWLKSPVNLAKTVVRLGQSAKYSDKTLRQVFKDVGLLSTLLLLPVWLITKKR